ncbi:hypothetical protein ACFL5V_08625 [Fibrobacterota bacterium]
MNLNKDINSQTDFLRRIRELEEKSLASAPLSRDEQITLLTHYLVVKSTRLDQEYSGD